MTDAAVAKPVPSVEESRAELQRTLDAIEDKLNVPKQLGILKKKAARSYDTQPLPWIAGATALVVAVGGLIAWSIFGRDDDPFE
ncbi:hypothetical protein BH09ACT1_BH09ACT1_29320 [soil metagenome]